MDRLICKGETESVGIFWLECSVVRDHLEYLRTIRVQNFDGGFYIKDYLSQSRFRYNTSS
jgi:hypothetical protein